MKKRRIGAALLAGAMLFCLPTPVNAQTEAQTQMRIVGYLPDWSYRAYEELTFSNLTHINIAFCNPDANGELFCYIPDEKLHEIVTLAHEQDVKVMIALGGAGGCDNYQQYLENPEKMAAFNENIMEYCDRYDLDGLDLDIELGSSHTIWNYYADWCQSLRGLCDERGMEMSTATAQWVAVKVSPETFALFDFVNVMAYDNDSDPVSHAGMNFSLSSLDYFRNQKQIPAQKLVLGVPFYGRGYTADGRLDWNSYVPFSEIIANNPENYHQDFMDGIAYNGADTMSEKCALGKQYGGIMIWELSQDAKGEYSLLQLIHDALAEPKETCIGDVNADGVLSIADVILLRQWLTGDSTAVLPAWEAGDLQSDGVLNAADLTRMKRALLKHTAESE